VDGAELAEADEAVVFVPARTPLLGLFSRCCVLGGGGKGSSLKSPGSLCPAQGTCLLPFPYLEEVVRGCRKLHGACPTDIVMHISDQSSPPCLSEVV